MDSIGERFVQEIIIGFAFLNGIFFSVRIDPEGMLIQFLLRLLSNLNPDHAGLLGAVFAILPIFVLIMIIWITYKTAGVLGLFATLLGFLAGSMLLTFAYVGIFLLIVAIMLGFMAPELCYHSL